MKPHQRAVAVRFIARVALVFVWAFWLAVAVFCALVAIGKL